MSTFTAITAREGNKSYTTKRVSQMSTTSKLSPLAVAIAMASTASFSHAVCDSAAIQIEVTSTADSIADDGVITLREALTSASQNCNTETDIITFSDSIAGQTIEIDTNESGSFKVLNNEDLKISGPTNKITITRNKQSSRVFSASAAKLQLENLIFDNQSEIAANNFVYADGNADLTIKSVEFRKNVTDYGGAIHVSESSSLTVNDAKFENNSARYGGAIRVENGGLIKIHDSEFNQNRSTGSGFGGAIAIEHATDLEITDSIFEGNISNSESGALHIRNNGGEVDYRIEDSEFNNNSADYSGGAIQYYHNSESGSSLTIQRSQFINNEADRANESHKGGGIYIRGNYAYVDVSVEDSTFKGNKAEAGAGIAADANNIDIELRINNSLFTENKTDYQGGGAIWMQPNESGNIELNLVNSTLSGNSATGYDDRNNGGYGGAVALWGSEKNSGINIIHSTIVNNTAVYGGGLHSFATANSAPIRVINSIIGANTATNGHQDIDQDVLTDSGVIHFEHSVIGDAGGLADARNNWLNLNNSSLLGNDGTEDNTSALDISAMIGPLQDNGGATLSHYPLSDQLVDQGVDLSLNYPQDQRGVGRSDGAPDIGAIEDSSSALIWQNFNDSNELILTTGQAINLNMDDYIIDGDKFALTYQADNLPAGLALSEDGSLTGNITSEGSYAIIVNVQDNYGGSAQSPQLNLTVSAPSKSNSGGAVFWSLLLTTLITTFRRGK